MSRKVKFVKKPLGRKNVNFAVQVSNNTKIETVVPYARTLLRNHPGKIPVLSWQTLTLYKKPTSLARISNSSTLVGCDVVWCER